MKKTRLSTLLLMLTFISSIFILVSCSSGGGNNNGNDITPTPPAATKLTAPTVVLTDDTASWSANASADKFEISIDGVLSFLENTVTSKKLTDGQSFKIRAIGDGVNYTSSDWSNSVTYTTVEQNGITATCTTEGKEADVVCISCGQTIEFGGAIPSTGHNYTEGTVDAGAHYCKCGHGEEHLFRTTEYETEVLCTCVICDYVAKFDANSRDKISKLPRIVVSDAYSLSGENEVVVYLELYSNVGITSAYFSVYFGDELELVRYSYGNILYKPSASAFKEYSDHLNVSLAQANTEVANPNYEASNTLLKLVFSTPKDATTGKEYPILVVNKAENSNGETKFVDKFTSSTGEPLDFIALNGKIKVVDRLPGDVVGDGSIDLLDAVIISKYSVLESEDRTAFLTNMQKLNEEFDISYGDVTLDNIYTNADAVQILRYIVGGYEARILAKEFYINLNYNDGTGNETNISARYDENGKIILNDLPVVERGGYRFDGWYYGFGKDSNKLDGNYLWNYDAIEQTLYAHYTLNSISFDGNGATGAMDDITYGDMDEWSVNNGFEKISNVYFDSKYSENASYGISLKHTFEGWALSPNGDVVYRAGQSISLKDDEIGNLTLYAIWSTEYVALPSIDRTGYKLGAWTSDKEGFSVAGNVNANYPITSDTTVYAKWNLIQYTIEYDGNGATDGNTSDISSRLHSAETSYQLAMNGYSRTGYQFTGWNTEADGSGIALVDGVVVSYIGAEIGNVVTLYAQWEQNKYDIVFNINLPSITNSSSYTGKASGTMNSLEKCLYDEDIILTENKFFVEGWIFKGWATSANGKVLYPDGSTQNNLAAKDGEKVNLYAVWAVDPYTVGKYVFNGVVVADTNGENSYTVYNYINETPQLKCGGKVIIDWSSCSPGEQNYVSAVNSTGTRYGGGNNNLDIVYGVTEVFFIGNPQSTYTEVYIDTVDYPIDSSLTIHIKEMNFESGLGVINSRYDDSLQDAGMHLTIECLGTNTITATSSGATAILNHKNLTITGCGNLTVKGGNGADATTAGANGNNGGIAISADNLTINMSGSLYVKGGNGSDGYEGKTGTHTSNGGNGGIGGNGGMAIDCQSVSITNPNATISITGGNGGNGGKGGYIPNGSNNNGMYNIPDAGNGGNGGNGGAPITISSLKNISCSSLEVKYGNGGDGGNGGNGGNPKVCDSDPDQKSHGGDGGDGGNGFVAGNGGIGGQGGGSYGVNRTWPRDNLHGTAGNGGNGGNGGNKIYGALYSDGFVQSLITDEDCGKAGKAGKAGPVIDAGEKIHGNPGSKGAPGTAGSIDNSYLLEFEQYALQNGADAC